MLLLSIVGRSSMNYVTSELEIELEIMAVLTTLAPITLLVSDRLVNLANPAP